MAAIEPAFPTEPYVLADHPVLDLLNTVATVHGEPFDFFQSNEDVVRWLARTGWIAESGAPAFEEGSLVIATRTLRETVRELVVQRKAGVQGYPEALNRYLAHAVSYPQLVWDSRLQLRIERVRQRQTPEQFVSPLAEAAAELLVIGDFSLIRTCEHPECILWFYDRTKAHRRRWCSMALCGNRHKVAEFRKRQR
ncbi:ABATE domain-containing protein [Thauera aromatica]|nr:ABATE domain-containing protein [Thauera aromatica]MCK2126829.1 ABATE domain-containing protein [Thauera aromatica]